MSLEWREQLSVGNDLIDDDHKRLIDIINRAELSLKSKNLIRLTTVLDELSAYSIKHFEMEEALAEAVGFPDVSRLHDSHRGLLAKLDRVKSELAATWDDAMADHFTALLREWLVNHVIKEDARMKPYLSRHAPRFDPR
ncbi:MAG: hemerythrin family protein [Rhodocyclales bacterium]|nr:hemerythrin family protein [Rhodocyclales bacterium]